MKDGAWQEDAKPRDIHGATGGIRTPDPRLRRPLLYPTELLTRWSEQQDLNLRPPGPKPGALPN